MDFKTTFIKSPRSRAFSTIELLMTVMIGGMALAGITSLTIYTMRSFAAIGNYMDLDKNSRNALDRLTQTVRQADGLLDFNEHSIVLSLDGRQMSFDYVPETKKFSMTQTNGTVKTLLENCEYLQFEVFQRNSVPGTYDQYPVAENESAAKLVQVSWICSKSLTGDLLNSESVQSAKIVIRKQ